MGRNKRDINSYLVEWPELEVNNNLLICKYCKILLPFKQNRIQEHFNSKKHGLMKSNFSKIMPLKNILYRDKTSSDEFEIDLVKIIIFDGLPFNAIKKESQLRLFLSKYCPSSRSLPDCRTLIDKHLLNIFQQSVSDIKNKMINVRFNLIIDESPDIKNRPIFNILACYYNHNLNKRVTLMLDSSRLLECNSVIIANQISAVLQRYDLEWDNCISIISDSASYMKKYFKDLRIMYPNIIKIPCFSHIIHLSVKKSIDFCFYILKKFCMKFSSLISKNRNAKKLFLIHLKNNNFDKIIEIPRVLDIRWYSFFNCLKQIKEYYPAVVDFLKDAEQKDYGIKINEILKEYKNKTILYFHIIFLIDTLNPIYEYSNFIEKEEIKCFSSLYDWVNNNFGIKKDSIFESIKNNLGIISFETRTTLIEQMTIFCSTLIDEMNQSISKHIKDCFPSENFLITIKNIDLKESTFFEEININDLCYFLKTKEKNELINEHYLLCKLLKSSTIKINNEFWKEKSNLCPIFSKLALELLAVPISSISVERSFSKLRFVFDKERINLSDDRLTMLSILNYNGQF